MFKKCIVENNPIYINNNRKIYNGITAENKPVLIKELNSEYKDESIISIINNEQNIVKGIDELCNIIHVNTSEIRPYIIYEKPNGNSLYDLYKSTDLSFTRIIEIFVKLLDAIESIHSKGYVHGHINPTSIYCNEDNVKIFNTGLYIINNCRIPYNSSSTYYCSDEMKKNEPLTFASDIYSLGKILLFLCTGKETATSIKNDKEYIKIIMDQCCININSAKNIYNYIVKATSNINEKKYHKIKYLKKDLFNIIRSIKSNLNELLFLNNEFYVQFDFTKKIIGRDIELNRVKKSFLSNSRISIISIEGESGVGKTEFSIKCLNILEKFGATPMIIDIKSEKINSKKTLYNYLIKDILEQFNHITKSYHKCDLSDEPKLILLELLQYDVFKTFIPAIYIYNLCLLDIDDQKEILNELETLPFFKGIVLIENVENFGGSDYNRILLSNFSLEQLTHFISDSITIAAESLSRFCEICFRKTLGNPYYLKDYLNRLYLNGVLWYNYDLNQYNVEFGKIDNITITSNLKKEIIKRIDKLTEEEQLLLKHLYCIGYEFELKDIFLIMNIDKLYILQLIKKLMSLEVIYLLDGIVSEFYWKSNSSSNIFTKFRFISKDIYSHISTIFNLNEEISIHYKIVNIYYNENIDSIFIAESMKKSWLLVSDHKLKNFYISNLFNKASCDYQNYEYGKSIDYLKVILYLLDKDIWEINYSFALNFYSLLIKTAFHSKNYYLIERYKSYILRKIRTIEDSEVIYRYSIKSMLVLGDRDDAWSSSVEFLMKLGFSIKSSNKFISTLKLHIMKSHFKYKKDKLLSSNYIANRRNQIILKFVTEILMYQVLTNKPEYLPLIISKILKIIRRWGISANVSYIIVLWLGLCTKIDKDFGDLRLSSKISKKISLITGDSDNCQLYSSLGLFYPGFKPLKEAIKTFKKGYIAGKQNRNNLWASYSIYEARCLSIYESYNLSLLVTDINADIMNLNNNGNILQVNNFKSILKTCNIMTGKEIQQDFIDFDDLYQGFTANSNILLQKASISLIFNQSSFYHLALKAYKSTDVCNSLYNEFLCRYYYVLSLLFMDNISISNHFTIIRNLFLIRKISHYAPWNFRHKYLFAKGYYLVKAGKRLNGFWLLDEAIIKAKKEKNYFDVGCFCERVSVLSKDIKRKNISNYILESYDAYKKWGAIAKCRQILNNNKDLLDIKFLQSNSNEQIKTGNSFTYSYDKTFYKQLLKNIIRKFNGNIGYIMIKKDGELLIDLVGDRLRNQYDNIKNCKLSRFSNLPVKLLEKIDKTRETIILNKSNKHETILKDSYMINNKIKSFTAGPLIFKDYYIGIYYIENRIKEYNHSVDDMLELKTLVELMSSYIYNYIIFPERNKTHELMKVVNKKDEEIKKLKCGSMSNKSEILSRLDYEVKMFKRYKEIFSIITVNILPLIESSTTIIYDLIRKSIRNIDSIVEMSKNNYILILPKTDSNGGDNLIQKIKKVKQLKKIDMDIVFNLFEYREGYNVNDIIKEISSTLNLKIM